MRRKTMRSSLVVLLCLMLTSAIGQTADFWQEDYKMADSIAANYQPKSLRDPAKLAHELTSNLPREIDKVRCIFRWITLNISYDTRLYRRDKKKSMRFRYNRKALGKWKDKLNRISDARTLNKRTAICIGYARLLDIMCTSVGIQSAVVSGYARNLENQSAPKPNHAWNSVRIGTKWYLLDATWASGYCDTKGKRFYRRFEEAYFLPDPSLLVSSHFPTDSTWMLLYKKPSLYEFRLAPLKTTGYILNSINSYSPSKGSLKAAQCDIQSFRISSNKSIETLTLNLYDSKQYDYWRTASRFTSKEGQTEFFVSLDVPPGRYTLDVFINSDHTFRYHIQVVRASLKKPQSIARTFP